MINVAQLLDDLRVVRAEWCLLEVGAPGGIRFPRTERAHLYLVLDGRASIACGQGAHVALQAGDCALLLRRKPHMVTDRPGSPAVRLRILEEANTEADAVPVARTGGRGEGSKILAGACSIAMSQYQVLTAHMDDVVVLRAGDEAGLGFTGETLGLLRRLASRPGAVAVMNRLAELLMINQLRLALAEALSSNRPELAALDHPQLRTALRIMGTRYDEDWSVVALAEAVGMSRTSFFTKFSSVVGKTPAQHLTELRMAEAVKLLRDERLKLIDVARQVGYESDVSFTRAFKRVHGVSPSMYRQRRQRPATEASQPPSPFPFVVFPPRGPTSPGG